MNKRLMKFILPLMIMLLAVAAICFNYDKLWKLTNSYIPIAMLTELQNKHNSFLGWDIHEVIPIISKNSKYYVFTQKSNNYYDWIIKYPDIVLDNDKDKLYCFAFSNGSSEELSQIGFFVNSENRIIGSQFDIYLPW